MGLTAGFNRLMESRTSSRSSGRAASAVDTGSNVAGTGASGNEAINACER
jgi:hypothetical protein